MALRRGWSSTIQIIIMHVGTIIVDVSLGLDLGICYFSLVAVGVRRKLVLVVKIVLLPL